MGKSKLNQPTIIVARHGQTNYNSGAAGSPERLRGWLNVPLNKTGQTEAVDLSKQLAGYPINNIFSSDLSRAHDTAQVVAHRHNLRVTPTQMLRPWNLGNFQGQDVSNVIPQLKKYVAAPSVPPPGGESFNSFRDRYLTFLTSVMRHAANGNTVALVTHTRNQQLTRAWLAAGGKPDFNIDQSVMDSYTHQPHTGQYLLMLPSDKGWQIHEPQNLEKTPREYLQNPRQVHQLPVG